MLMLLKFYYQKERESLERGDLMQAAVARSILNILIDIEIRFKTTGPLPSGPCKISPYPFVPRRRYTFE